MVIRITPWPAALAAVICSSPLIVPIRPKKAFLPHHAYAVSPTMDANPVEFFSSISATSASFNDGKHARILRSEIARRDFINTLTSGFNPRLSAIPQENGRCVSSHIISTSNQLGQCFGASKGISGGNSDVLVAELMWALSVKLVGPATCVWRGLAGS